MPIQAKIGEFKPVPQDTIFGKILTVCQEYENSTVVDLAADLDSSAKEVVAQLRAARGRYGIDHVIDPLSKIVSIVYPLGVDDNNVFRVPADAARVSSGAGRPYKLGDFRQVRRASRLGRIVEHVVTAPVPGATIHAAAAAIGEPLDATVALLKSARRTHGIDHRIGEDGSLSLILPAGHDPFVPDLGHVVPEGAAPRARTADLDALAASGIFPERPVITSPTNLYRQAQIDRIAALADNDRWDELATFEVSGSNAYAIVARRYRDRLLAAHRALHRAGIDVEPVAEVRAAE
jgi:hypothetical protein